MPTTLFPGLSLEKRVTHGDVSVLTGTVSELVVQQITGYDGSTNPSANGFDGFDPNFNMFYEVKATQRDRPFRILKSQFDNYINLGNMYYALMHYRCKSLYRLKTKRRIIEKLCDTLESIYVITPIDLQRHGLTECLQFKEPFYTVKSMFLCSSTLGKSYGAFHAKHSNLKITIDDVEFPINNFLIHLCGELQ